MQKDAMYEGIMLNVQNGKTCHDRRKKQVHTTFRWGYLIMLLNIACG